MTDIEHLNIKQLDETAMSLCKERWNSIAHPLHSLGKLEDLLVGIAGISGNPKIVLEKKALVVMCADNGVVAEGVTQTGQDVTAIVTDNFAKNQASAAVLCQSAGADIFPVDIGVAGQTHVIPKKVACGTKNMVLEPAMSMKEVKSAIDVGIDMVRQLKADGYAIIATGEMGIGNTTTSSAVAAVLLDEPVVEMTGRGAGLDQEGLKRKICAIEKAIKKHHPDPSKPLEVLASVGGLDIAGIVGLFLGGGIYGVPIVIDGFISSVAALLAVRLYPEVSSFMIASHLSKEPASQKVMAALGLEAGLHLDMCLGEGTGAVMLFPILDMAADVYHQMGTFSDNEIEAYQPLSEV